MIEMQTTNGVKAGPASTNNSFFRVNVMKNVLEYLENSTQKTPDKVAVIDENGRCTYEQMMQSSRHIASSLVGQIRIGEPVAVLMEKGIPALTSFWGIVYAGGFYVFFNPELPTVRLQQMQQVLGARRVITDKDHAETALQVFAPEAVCFVEECRETPVREQALQEVRDQMIDTDPLYANFTSGSTGTPKGVVVSHRSVLDFIDVFVPLFHITEKDRIANQAPFDFDVSVKDIYSAIKTGATLVTVPKTLFSRPVQLLDYLCDNRITTMIWAVSALCLITTFHGLDYRVPDTVQKVLFSGEVMPAKHLANWRSHLPHAMFVNLYGPTEITCNCTYYMLEPERDYKQGLPIGKAFPNEQVFLLDEQNQLVTSPGTEGEICGPGPALALGYFRAPEQTAAAFVQNPLNPWYPERIYRTGDLGRYGEDGELYFTGRKDFQIKHMGHRIELEEVERAIAAQPGIDRCCCVFDEKKHKLYGFYIGDRDKKELHTQLRQVLPVYMVPGALYQMENFPLTKNGKTDRKLLLERRGQL